MFAEKKTIVKCIKVYYLDFNNNEKICDKETEFESGKKALLYTGLSWKRGLPVVRCFDEFGINSRYNNTKFANESLTVPPRIAFWDKKYDQKTNAGKEWWSRKIIHEITIDREKNYHNDNNLLKCANIHDNVM